ncbi:MAG: hypothetical protein DRJ43_03735 [Thermoprotei archaeon]|nr:MAG: hypothetical protein DRJ43_03735 [Thermoprotei archaeon]
MIGLFESSTVHVIFEHALHRCPLSSPYCLLEEIADYCHRLSSLLSKAKIGTTRRNGRSGGRSCKKDV